MSGMTPAPTAVTRSDSSSRRGGLIGWGVFLIVVGAIVLVAMAGLVLNWVGAIEMSLAQPAARPVRGRPAAPPLRSADLVGVVISLAAGAGAVWTGIGCCLGRRWVRSVVMVTAVFVAVMGLMTFIPMTLSLPSVLDALDASARRRMVTPTPAAVLALFGIRAAIVLGLGVVLPYLMFRFFASHRTVDALDALDPRVTWADRCPVPVLGWSAYAGLVGASALLRLTWPSLPAFVVNLTGGPAIVALCVVGVVMGWGAWLCYRQDRLGWVMTFVLLVALRASTATFLWTGGGLGELIPDPTTTAAVARLQHLGVPPWWLPAVMASAEAVLVAVFGLLVARYFSPRYRVAVLPDHG